VCAVLVPLAMLVYVLGARGAPVIPVPNPLVTVQTTSGTVHHTYVIPVGGAPLPIDVNDDTLLGRLLTPDVDVSVGLVALDQLPGKPVVPNIVVKRDPVAVLRHEAAPPLKIDFKIVIQDAAHGLSTLATVHYGYETPPGGTIPPNVTAELTGPATSGFVNPLEAIITSPGYGGPLQFNVHATTQTFDGNFAIRYNPLPERIHFIEQSRSDGLTAEYDHQASNPDIKLDAAADLRNPSTGELIHAAATVERLPQQINLSDTNTGSQTSIDYQHGTVLAKPDVSGFYRDTLGNGTVVTDASFRVAGLPSHIQGQINTAPNGSGGSDLDSATFNVLGGDQIDSLDFLARNWIGDPGPIPEPALGPEQFLAVATRRLPGGVLRYRAAGRLEGIRSVTFKRAGASRKGFDVTADIGDGIKPLRAIADLDGRGPGAPSDAQRLALDTTIAPLPRQIHALYEPSTGGTVPTHILYEANQTTDIDATASIDKAQFNGCGQPQVTCLTSHVDKLSPTLDILLPGDDGTDFTLTRTNGATGTSPDVQATVDRTPADTSKRTWAQVGLIQIPQHVTGRLDAAGGVVKAAEFHACSYDFTARACTDQQEALGRVTFTVRPQPDRGSLPPRPDTVPDFVSFIKRQPSSGNSNFEVMGQVDDIRNVVFHQRAGDPQTLGALVDVGSKSPFDVAVDQADIPAQKSTKVTVHVNQLPDSFSACVRQTQDASPPTGLPADPLLAPCEDNSVVSTAAGEPVATPLAAAYSANSSTDVTAHVLATKPDDSDGGQLHSVVLDTTIHGLPKTLSAYVIPPISPGEGGPARKLRLVYKANQTVPKVDFALESRRATSICEDPRPNRDAMCITGSLTQLPSKITTVVNPDDSVGQGDIDIKTDGAANQLSVNPLHLSIVKPDSRSPLVVDGHINNLSPHLHATLNQEHTPADDPGKKSLVNVHVDACPDPVPCQGIGEIQFTATNALVPAILAPALPPPEPGIDQSFSYVQRGEDFQADGLIKNFKEVRYSKLDGHGNLSPTTNLRAAFGNGSPAQVVRAWVDIDSGTQAEKVNALISKAPQAVNVCIRDALTSGSPGDPNDPALNFCDKAPADKLALQTKLDTAAGGVKPDINVRQFEFSKGGGSNFLTGSARIYDLAQRIDVLAGKGDQTDVNVEGHNIDDAPNAPPQDVAGRVAFALQNYAPRTPAPSGFPYDPLPPLTSADDVATDPNNHDTTPTDTTLAAGDDHNFVKLIKSNNDLNLSGSIPDVKRINMHPGPCNANDPRFPSPSSFTIAGNAPEYKCVNVIAAQNKPLGVAVRTLDPDNSALAIDQGHLDSVPGGAGGISATITKSPDTVKLAPTCGEGGSPPFCRPPLLSVSAPKASGQQSNLEARMAIGDLGLLGTLAGQRPSDVVSQQLDYEKNPHDFDHDGVRLKLGTQTAPDGSSLLGLRAGMKIPLPNFLDVYSPTVFTCQQKVLGDGNCLKGSDAAAVSSDNNTGYESKDIQFKIVGTDNQPNGNGTPCTGTPTDCEGTAGAYLGRVAVFVHDFDKGGDTIVTGAPDSNGAFGTKTWDPENLPPAGAYDDGLLLPSHFDVRVYMRNKYQAPGDDDVQANYTQVDGRWNAPLTMSVRVDPPADNGPGVNRANQTVPNPWLSVFNAPGLGNGVNDYTHPTFRLRALTKKKHHKDDPAPYDCTGFSGRAAGFGADLCILTPNPQTAWADVGLNAKPTSQPAVRTVEAIVDGSDGNKVDLAPYQNIQSPGGSPKGPPGPFTPQAGLRLTPFDVGLKVGAGIGIIGGSADLVISNDLIVRLAGLANERVSLHQHSTALKLKSAGGKATIDLDPDKRTVASLQVHAEALFGLVDKTIVDLTTDPYAQAFDFRDCGTAAILASTNHADVTNDNTKWSIALAPNADPFSGFGSGAAADAFNALSEIFAPIGCLVFGTDDLSGTNYLINDNNPAPPFDFAAQGPYPARPIEDAATPSAPGPVSAPANGFTAQDVTIPSVQNPSGTYCGTLTAKTLHVLAGGFINVGRQGTTVTHTITDAEGHNVTVTTPCDGSLLINADAVTVDPGGTISANAVRTSSTGGTPNGHGGGAGHAGAGGASGLGGNPGGATYGGPSAAINDFGSPGAPASGGTSGGLGGGSIVIDSTNSLTIRGRVSATGGAGAAHVGTTCSLTGAGGGSGGDLALMSNRVTISGTASVAGGRGGNGVNGGGGGGGGRIQIDTIEKHTPGTVTAAGGGAGLKGGSCNNGVAGSAGNAALGTTINFAAGISRSDTNPFVRGSVTLNVDAVNPPGNAVDVYVCHRSAPIGTAQGFQSSTLDPPSTATTGPQLVSTAAGCNVKHFSPSDFGGTDEASGTITISGLSDGYYGFYAFAAKPGVFGNCSSGFNCTYQSLLPNRSPIRIASDSTAPNNVQGQTLNGNLGCPPAGASKCINNPNGQLSVSAADNFSGVAFAACVVDGDVLHPIPCGPASSVTVPLGGDGQHHVQVVAFDNAGNASAPASADFPWFVDTHPPGKPTISVTPIGSQHNGWYHIKPQVSVSATDPSPSSGFNKEAIVLTTDEATAAADNKCGAATDSSTDGCSAADTAAFVPVGGIHTFNAKVTDRAGWVSPESATATMKVDANPPISRLLVGPGKPDGSNGWYATQPFFALAAADHPGESGVDLTPDGSDPADPEHVSGIFYTIDGGATKRFDPNADNRVPEGVHTICYWAVDIADNQELPHQCSAPIKVDTTAPVVSAAINPANPDGRNSWYLEKPTITPSGTDPQGAGVNQVSGIDRVEYQIDNGPWTSAAPFQAPEGQHDIRVRAFDNAGNPATVVERTVRVDLSAPTAQIGLYPPAPNSQGWFRQSPIVSIASSDGRDSPGVDGATYQVDGNTPINYLGEFPLPEGVHNVRVRSFDLAGKGSPVFSDQLSVDLTPPVPAPADPVPTILLLIRGLLHPPAILPFNVQDNLGLVKVRVQIYNVLGNVVRTIPAPGKYPDGFRDPGYGSVSWDGSLDNGTHVLPGLYFYRVQAIDQAGNSALSTESHEFLVGLTGLPL
jgi:hypothetical protein